jgi:acyl-CoA hydrolase
MTDLLSTHIQNREMVQPNHANNLQSVHGGNVMKWMDEIGAMSAMRFAGNACVTARINQVDFEQPIRVGDVAFIDSYVYRAGRTSVNVRLQTYREDPTSGEREKTTESYFVYVAIDDDGNPIAVPDLTVESKEGERLRAEALDRTDE